MKTNPLIIYIPGLLPKPEPEAHREALLRCLLEGVRRIDPEVAADLDARSQCFDLVSWTYDFYKEHRDIGLDMPAIETLLQQQGPTEQDIAEAVSWKRRGVRMLYQAGDLLPFLIPQLANEQLRVHLRDLRRYIQNKNEIADLIRRRLKMSLEAAALVGRPILLLAHSLGSVIAYDALWQLSRKEHKNVLIEQLVTMGSPLGQRYIQHRLLSYHEQDERHYPNNLRRWTNISAVGDLTSLDSELRQDFAAMERLSLVAPIKDLNFFNFFRLNGVLNVHAEYGYLINEVTARQVRDWWCEKR